MVLLILGGSAGTVPGQEAPSLSSLRPGRQLQVRQGAFPRLWVTCGGECAFLLLGRESLEGQVNIQTPEQALEFVRLSTTQATSFWGPVRMTEVFAGEQTHKFRFIVPKEQFARCCVPVTVTLIGSAEQPSFTVQRTVVQRSDYGVYSLKETVTHDGHLYRDEMRLLSKDGRSLGTFVELPAP